MPGVATSPATEAVLTIAPRFCCSMTGNTWRSPRNTPFTLTPMTCVEHRLVIFGGVRQFAFDAGIVEEAVDRAVGVERRLHIVLHLGRFGDVGGDEARLAALLADDAGGRLAAAASRSTTTTLAPRFGEGQRRGPADAVARAGDQRDLAGEVQIHGVPPIDIVVPRAPGSSRHAGSSVGRITAFAGSRRFLPDLPRPGGERRHHVADEAPGRLVGQVAVGVELGLRLADQHLGLVQAGACRERRSCGAGRIAPGRCRPCRRRRR